MDEFAFRKGYKERHHRVRQNCTSSLSGEREHAWPLLGVASHLAGQV
ncbi:hypothetical protein [Streptomyces sp. Qhu-G9]|nr:hypothetical protein [Streptomyces aurantiacus]